jgi:arylsulfatase A-like enzyme
VQHRRTRWPEEVFAQISEAQVARAVRTRRWKYCVSAPDKHPSRDVGSDSYVEEALYDLAADPYELNNLIGYVSHRGVANVLQRRLLRCMARAGEARPTIVRAPEVRSGQKQVMPGEERL